MPPSAFLYVIMYEDLPTGESSEAILIFIFFKKKKPFARAKVKGTYIVNKVENFHPSQGQPNY